MGKKSNGQGVVYFPCPTKTKVKCLEPCIREEELDRQLSSLIQKFSLRPDWAAELTAMLEKKKTEAAQSSTAFVQEAGNKIRAIQTKLQRLLDGYWEQDIEREIYRFEKAKLLSEKKSLEEQMARIEQKRTGWLEPMAEWIKEASSLPKITQEDDLFAKKVMAKEIFGSNLVLAGGEKRAEGAQDGGNAPQNQWAAVAAAHQMALKKPSSFIVVRPPGFEPGTNCLKGSCSTIELWAQDMEFTSIVALFQAPAECGPR